MFLKKHSVHILLMYVDCCLIYVFFMLIANYFLDSLLFNFVSPEELLLTRTSGGLITVPKQVKNSIRYDWGNTKGSSKLTYPTTGNKVELRDRNLEQAVKHKNA